MQASITLYYSADTLCMGMQSLPRLAASFNISVVLLIKTTNTEGMSIYLTRVDISIGTKLQVLGGGGYCFKKRNILEEHRVF